MAISSNLTDQALEFQLFGRPLQTEDWLKDIRLRTSLLLLPVPPRDIVRLLTSRVARRSAFAIPHAERIVKSLEDRTEAFLVEIGRLREALEASAYAETASGSAIADAYQDDIDCEAGELTEERRKLLEEWALLRSPGSAAADRAAQAQRYIEQAFSETGSDRGILLREARNALAEVANAQPVVHPILWLVQGWATWQITDNYVEAMAVLQRAEQHPVPSLALSLAYRMLSYFCQLDEQPTKAGEWAQKALEVRPGPETCVEAALCAAALRDPAALKANLESAFVFRSGAIITALSDERILSGGPSVLEVAVRVSHRLRRDGRRAATVWSSAAKEVAEAQKLCSGIHVPYELAEGHKRTVSRLEEADLIIGGHLTRSSRANATEILNQARMSLQSEFVKRCDAVSMARKSIENAAVLRDQKIRGSANEQEEVNRRANALLARSDLEAERAEKGSLFGFAGGCALFGLYMISFLILSDRGVAIGITTPIGIGSVLVSAVPIVAAIALQVRHGVRRIALEHKIEEGFRRTKLAQEKAAEEAEDEYREQVRIHRKALAVADAELKKVENAMRALGVKHQPLPQLADADDSAQETEVQAEAGDTDAGSALESAAA